MARPWDAPFELKARAVMDWSPLPGHYVQSARPRVSYLIHQVKKHEPRGKARYNRTLTVTRLHPSQVPEGATVHFWEWDKRKKKGTR